MRFVNEKTGLGRIRSNESYKAGIKTNFHIHHKVEESEDTKIRRDIYSIIIRMSNENKSSIEIKVFLTDKYPNYEEYIIKMINQHFGKITRTKTSDNEKAMKDNE